MAALIRSNIAVSQDQYRGFLQRPGQACASSNIRSPSAISLAADLHPWRRCTHGPRLIRSSPPASMHPTPLIPWLPHPFQGFISASTITATTTLAAAGAREDPTGYHHKATEIASEEATEGPMSEEVHQTARELSHGDPQKLQDLESEAKKKSEQAASELSSSAGADAVPANVGDGHEEGRKAAQAMTPGQ